MNIQQRAPRFARFRRGVTLVELTVVISVLLVMVAVLYIGASAWKNNADRASCVLNIRQMQVAVRAYANYNNHYEGEDISPTNLRNKLIATGSYFDVTPSCPSTGNYLFGGNVIPDKGTLYMTCTLASSQNHQPNSFEQW